MPYYCSIQFQGLCIIVVESKNDGSTVNRDTCLYFLVDKELLYGLAVPLMQPCMMDTYAKGQGQLQVGVPDPRNDVLHLKPATTHTDI